MLSLAGHQTDSGSCQHHAVIYMSCLLAHVVAFCSMCYTCDRSMSKYLTQLVCLQVQFNGMTPLGTMLNQKIIQPFLMGGIQTRNLSKPILVIIITDGEPTGEPKTTVAQVIKNAKNMAMNSPYGPGAIAFEFAQVGKDQAAQAFLGQLDKDPGELVTLYFLNNPVGQSQASHKYREAVSTLTWAVTVL